MLFTSIEFLFLFLPTVLAVYYALPDRFALRNNWLLISSLAFYAWGEPSFVFAMLISVAFNYLAALAVDRRRSGFSGKLIFIAALAGNLSLLGAYKYLNFVTATVRDLFPSCCGAVPQTSILLPIGISFFTFQAMSYLMDVRRGEPAQRNPLSVALYIALFPQLIAGPIVRYTTVADQIRSRCASWDLFSSGVMRFLVGFNKKMLLANVLAEAADRMFAAPAQSVSGAVLGAVAYTLQIYFDFSAYSDMAIGLGRMFGFRFLENFDYPYVSRTVTEFWRRWHISLGSWFRDYVYIPMGGSRVGKARLIVNLAVVWMLTGIWHGANWTFILWGTLYGLVLIAEKLTGWSKLMERRPVLGVFGWPLTMFAVVTGWVLFRSESIYDAIAFAGAMFGISDVPLTDAESLFWWREMAVVIPVSLAASAPLGKFFMKIRPFAAMARIAQCILFVVGVSCLVMKAHNPFIYFNF